MLVLRFDGLSLLKQRLVDLRNPRDRSCVVGLLLVTFVDQLFEKADSGTLLVLHLSIQFHDLPDHMAQFFFILGW